MREVDHITHAHVNPIMHPILHPIILPLVPTRFDYPLLPSALEGETLPEDFCSFRSVWKVRYRHIIKLTVAQTLVNLITPINSHYFPLLLPLHYYIPFIQPTPLPHPILYPITTSDNPKVTEMEIEAQADAVALAREAEREGEAVANADADF
jgi:hypothetical protein